MKNITLIFLLISSQLFGQQAHFITSGTIEFQRKVNMLAIIPKMINKDNEVWLVPEFDNFKKSQPQFKVLNSTLYFADNKSLFIPAEDESNVASIFLRNIPIANQNNTVYVDHNKRASVSQKKVFDQIFKVTDTIQKIKWKITDETREIAGYNCRRANAIILDSVYVVAFYSPDIPLSGGPESFSGLPGMILGVALPHENISWFATKITDMTLAPNVVVPPQKGKPMDYSEFKLTLKKAFKEWGNEASFFSKAFSL